MRAMAMTLSDRRACTSLAMAFPDLELCLHGFGILYDT